MEPDSPPQTTGQGEPHSRLRLYGATASALALGGALSYIGLTDPHRPDSLYPQCPFKWLTGWNCPGCGGLRMTHDLLHGDLAAAFNDNAMLLLGIPLLALWILWRRRRARPTRPAMTSIAVAVTLFVWTVVRNVPGFPLVPTVLSG